MKCFFDMAGRFPWRGPGYGRGFRIGDRAAAYARLLQWRTMNPTEPLLVFEDVSWPECSYAHEFGANWMFCDLNVTIRHLTTGETVPRPEGNNLYNRNLWSFWRELRGSGPEMLKPSIRPSVRATKRASDFLNKHGLTAGQFVVIQPLFDAGYNTYRNRAWDWWLELVRMLEHSFDVVVAVNTKYADLPRTGVKGSVFTADCNLSPMEVLAVIEAAGVFVGGETGLTLWAPIVQTATYGIFNARASTAHHDSGPISFGRPVSIADIGHEPAKHAWGIAEFISDHQLIV